MDVFLENMEYVTFYITKETRNAMQKCIRPATLLAVTILSFCYYGAYLRLGSFRFIWLDDWTIFVRYLDGDFM